ncbi:MAG: virulence factor MviN, partial [Nitrospinaceae bacterium]|nr:virulence factor MviN [Nitrospinaceae bacterium]NIR55926.1 virulence factor MviN [Nitrospinaceae bacterium]NIS86373.1 virulence factor MviN [Nitrospinaceae bacterium]NIT83206.1 virulence factor MviN [Nitrospinaceae bacterium]NIU45420.1 virulence factor MviN [Nitrospinaceae bacterium]
LSMVGTALSLVMYAAHHARQRFVVVEWSATIAGVAALAFLVWGLPRMGVHAAAWATVVRAGIQMVYLMPALGRFHLPNFQSPSIQVALKRIRPLVLGTSYYKTDLLVDRFLASLAPAGGLSLLHLAQQMYGAGQQVLNKALSNPIVPVLSRKARNEEWELHGQITTHRILWMMGATGLVVLVLWAVGRPVLDGVFGHGNFDPPAIQDLWGLMLFLGPALIARSAGQILTTSFYSMGNTLTPTVVGSLGYTLGIVLRIALFYKYGLFGLAVAISLQAVL